MWFSMDAHRVCMRAEGEVPLANIKAILQRVEGPGSERWIKSGGMEQGEQAFSSVQRIRLPRGWNSG